MIKKLIYGVLGFSASALFVGNLLITIPDRHIANTSVDDSRPQDDHEQARDYYLDDDEWELYAEDYYAEFGEYPERELYDDEELGEYEGNGDYALHPLFNTYHIAYADRSAVSEEVAGTIGRINPMYYTDKQAEDYSSGASYSWSDVVDDSGVEEGVTLGFDTEASAEGGDQIVALDVLTMEELFKYYGVLPVDDVHYNFSSPYGPRVDPITGDDNVFHAGLDIASATIDGANVYSVLPGAVSHVGYNSDGYGHFIVINHGDFTSLYAHLQEEPSLEIGTEVDSGDVIGIVGTTGRSTGPHLHFELSVDSVKVDPEPLLALVGTGVGEPTIMPSRESSEDEDEGDDVPTDDSTEEEPTTRERRSETTDD